MTNQDIFHVINDANLLMCPELFEPLTVVGLCV